MRRSTGLIGFCVVALMSPVALGGTFHDDFSGGLNPTYWTVTQTTPGLYSVDASHGNVQLARLPSRATDLENVTIWLNLAAAVGQAAIAGDFSAQIEFSGAHLVGSGLDQAELHTKYQDGSGFYDVRSNDLAPGTFTPEQNVHVYNFDGQLHGYTQVSSDSGTFTITRSGAIVSGYFDGSLLFSESNTSPLTAVNFVLQNYNGNDQGSVTFDNFSMTASVPEPSSIALLATALPIAAVSAARSRAGRARGRGR